MKQKIKGFIKYRINKLHYRTVAFWIVTLFLAAWGLIFFLLYLIHEVIKDIYRGDPIQFFN